MNEIGNLTEAMTADKPRERQRHDCPDCPADYTSEVNLRAHQYRMHQKANLRVASTRDLLEELHSRFSSSGQDLPNGLDEIRYLLHGLNEENLAYRPVERG